MYNLDGFREQIKARLRDTYLPDGNRATQSDMAKAVYLSVAELSKRLHATRGTKLNHDNIRDIILTLARWQALDSEAEVVELLNLVECPAFSEAEWAAPPLKRLKRLDRREGNRVGSRQHNLPLALSSFIGRSREIEQCLELLTSTRLLTIAGAGGVGKTRLAIEVADRLLDPALGRYPSGIYLIRLDALTNGDLIAQLVAATLGVREESARPLPDTLTDYLQNKRMLLVLDNCEHLVEAAAALAEALLSRCSDLTILATSREALLILGETSWQLPSLTLPETERDTDLASLRQSEAVSLFVKRASEGLPGWSLNQNNAAAVSEICRRLDGIPLAIELAAARVRAIGVREIAAGLDQCFRMLGSGARTALPRQQTIRASIEWSWGLLGKAERKVLERMAVLAPGWDLAAMQEVCADNDGDIEVGEVVSLIGQLAQKSLLVREVVDDTMRYRLLDTIRQYALEQLTARGGVEAARSRHLDYYLKLAVEVEPHLRGPQQVAWLNRLGREHDNLRTAFDYALGSEQPEAALRLSVALARFWQLRGYLNEGRTRLSAALGSNAISEQSRAQGLNQVGVILRMQGELNPARQFHEQALAIGRQTDDRQSIATALYNLGLLHSAQGNIMVAQPFHEEQLAIGRVLGDKWQTAAALASLGQLATKRGDYTAARSFQEEALQLRREMSDKSLVAASLIRLGNLDYIEGKHATARRLFEEALNIGQELESKSGIPMALIYLGNVAVMQGEYVTAQRLFADVLALARELGSKWQIAYACGSLGLIECIGGNYAAALALYRTGLTINRENGDQMGVAEQLAGMSLAEAGVGGPAVRRATRLLAAAAALMTRINSTFEPMERIGYDSALELCQSRLDEISFAAEWRVSEGMTGENAIAYALGESE